MDVHAKTVVLAELVGESREPLVREVPNDPRKLRETFGRLMKRGRVQACYEAGACGFEIQRMLDGMGVACQVVAPSLIPSKPGDRVKTDRRDAVKLVRLLRADELTAIVVPTSDQEAARDLVRARDDLRRARIAARHQLSKFLLRHGRHYTAGVAWTQKHGNWLKSQKFEQSLLCVTFDHYLSQLEYLDLRMAALDAEIAKLAKSPPFETRVAALTCLRGVSTLTAMILLTELGDLRRFKTPRQLMSYVGIVPGERSSGESVRRTGITKTGNAHVRRALVEAAWGYRSARTTLGTRAASCVQAQPREVASIAVKATTRLARRFGRLSARGKKPQVVVTAIARELCGFIWALGVAELPKAA